MQDGERRVGRGDLALAALGQRPGQAEQPPRHPRRTLQEIVARARGSLRQGRLEQLPDHAEGEVALELATARAQGPRPRRLGDRPHGADERRLADARRALDHEQAAVAALRPRHRRLDARELRITLEDAGAR